MPRFAFDIDGDCKEDEIETRSFQPHQAKRTRYTSTRFTLEDSVDDYCFEHGIPTLSPKETLGFSAESPHEAKDFSQLVFPMKRKPSIPVRDEIDRLALLLDAAVYVSDRQYTQAALPPSAPNASAATLSSTDRSRIQAEMKVLRERSDDRNRRNQSKIKALIDASLAAAEEIRVQQEKEQKDNDARERVESEARGRAEAEAKERAEADATAAAAATTPPRAAATETESSEPRTSHRSARDPAAVSTTSSQPSRESSSRANYVEKANKLIQNLVLYKQSADRFANSSAKQRRLAMKKLVIRSLNTLTQDDLAKNSNNARALAQAIITAQSEDEQIKAQNPSQSELAKGKRFLVNLLAGDVIKRVQAEGFNGTRGDGFVLAATVAAISVAAKDIIAILTAHIYTVCPLAIPKLPSENTDEVAFMKELGMLQDDNGEFETFERYLSRTESIISLVADIMASVPKEHTLLEGNMGAVPWLQRFLSALPTTGALPIFVAPVLTGFLTGAGHMLANVYADNFKTILEKVDKEIVPRLDTTAAGAPSATRLKQTLEGGIRSFASTLPPKAIPSLYFGTVTSAGSSSTAASSSPFARQSPAPDSSSSPFGPSNPQSTSGQFTSIQATVNPFGGATPNANEGSSNNGKQKPCKFFAQGNCRFGDKCKFSHETQTGFGTSTTTSNPSPFGSQPSAAPSPFGTTTAPTPSQFGTNAPSPSPFGQPTAPSPFGPATPNAYGSTTAQSQSPFGVGPAPSPSPFGGAASPASAPFGGNVPSPSPFGNTPSQPSFGAGSNPAPSLFSAGIAPTPSPFGTGTGTAPAPTPFGAGVTPTPSPFGAGVTPTPSPFGAGVTPTPSPFVGSTNPSPFAGGNTTVFGGNSAFGAPTAPAPSSFGSQSQAQFGGIAPTPSPFGASAPPFGGATAPTSFPGTSPTALPFGATAPATFGANQPSPFGMGTQSPFGTTAPSKPFGSPAPSPFGSSQPFGSPAPTPLGSTPSPFGSSVNAAPPFGSAAGPSPSPFGSVSTGFGTQPNKPPLFGVSPAPFGSSNQPFGTTAPAPSPFSTPSPFGAPAPSSFGTATNSTPFGSTAPASNTFGSSPFGSSGTAPSTTFGAPAFGNNTPFGSSSNTGVAAAPTPFGSASSGFGQQRNNSTKQPCKFFAQGYCRFGTNCRFSHETQSSSSPFGNYRR